MFCIINKLIIIFAYKYRNGQHLFVYEFTIVIIIEFCIINVSIISIPVHINVTVSINK